MAHYNYFIDHPNLRARLNWRDPETGTSAWVVEYSTTKDGNNWEEATSFQMTIEEIEKRIYSGWYMLEFE